MRHVICTYILSKKNTGALLIFRLISGSPGETIIFQRLFVEKFMYKLPFCTQYLYFIYFHLFSLSYISMRHEASVLEVMIIEISTEEHPLTEPDLGCHFL